MESLRYNYRKSALEKEKTYELTKDGIEVTELNKPSTITAYEEITEVNLSYAPTKYATVYQCSVKADRSHGFLLKSHHFAGLADFEDRSTEYVSFVKGLHKILHVKAPGAKFRKGIKPAAYVFSMIMFGIAGLVFPLMTILALFFGNYISGGIGVIACLFLFLKMRSYMKKNKPGTYSPQELPESLLPTSGSTELPDASVSEVTLAEE